MATAAAAMQETSRGYSSGVMRGLTARESQEPLKVPAAAAFVGGSAIEAGEGGLYPYEADSRYSAQQQLSYLPPTEPGFGPAYGGVYQDDEGLYEQEYYAQQEAAAYHEQYRQQQQQQQQYYQQYHDNQQEMMAQMQDQDLHGPVVYYEPTTSVAEGTGRVRTSDVYFPEPPRSSIMTAVSAPTAAAEGEATEDTQRERQLLERLRQDSTTLPAGTAAAAAAAAAAMRTSRSSATLLDYAPAESDAHTESKSEPWPVEGTQQQRPLSYVSTGSSSSRLLSPQNTSSKRGPQLVSSSIQETEKSIEDDKVKVPVV